MEIMLEPRPRRRGASDNPAKFASHPPTLVDALIILFVSASLVLFLFWLATRLGNFPVLETLPSYISDAFRSIWTSAATGTVGIGLAIYRALVNRDSPRPHYLLWILLTTLVLSGLTLAFAQVLYQRGPVTTLVLPSDIQMLTLDPRSNRPAEVKQQTLRIHNYSNMGVAFSLEGEYSVADARIEGTIRRSQARLNELGNSAGAPARVAGIGVSLCRVILDGKREAYDVLPAQPNSATFIPIERTLVPGNLYDFPSMKFRIDVPPEISSDRWWLCAQVWNTAGGNYPGYQSEKPLNADLQTPSQAVAAPLIDWVPTKPVDNVNWYVVCQCAVFAYGEPAGPRGTALGDQAFIEIRNDCRFPIDVFAYKLLSPDVPPDKLLVEAPDKKFAATKLRPETRARFSLAGAYGGSVLVQSCAKK